MISATGGAAIGAPKVFIANGRGFTPEELLEQYMDRFISISDRADPQIRDQAQAFKLQVARLVLEYGRQVRDNHTNTLASKFDSVGQTDTANLIRNI